MAIRKITEEQFTDGSTIDGTRINKAFTDTFSTLNNLPIGEVEQCFIPRTIHLVGKQDTTHITLLLTTLVLQQTSSFHFITHSIETLLVLQKVA